MPTGQERLFGSMTLSLGRSSQIGEADQTATSGRMQNRDQDQINATESPARVSQLLSPLQLSKSISAAVDILPIDRPTHTPDVARGTARQSVTTTVRAEHHIFAQPSCQMEQGLAFAKALKDHGYSIWLDSPTWELKFILDALKIIPETDSKTAFLLILDVLPTTAVTSDYHAELVAMVKRRRFGFVISSRWIKYCLETGFAAPAAWEVGGLVGGLPGAGLRPEASGAGCDGQGRAQSGASGGSDQLATLGVLDRTFPGGSMLDYSEPGIDIVQISRASLVDADTDSTLTSLPTANPHQHTCTSTTFNRTKSVSPDSGSEHYPKRPRVVSNIARRSRTGKDGQRGRRFKRRVVESEHESGGSDDGLADFIVYDNDSADDGRSYRPSSR